MKVLRRLRSQMALVLTLSAVMLGVSQAAMVSIGSTAQGAYREEGFFGTGGSGGPNGTLLSGKADSEFRSFFVFDVSSVVGSATSASLQISNIGCGVNCTYFSADASEHLGLFAYAGDVSALVGGSGGLSAFNDLGDGLSYGGLSITDADGGALLTISLNAAALSAINSAGGLFALGGSVDSLSGASVEYVFGGVNAQAILAVETSVVPEPSSIALIGLAMLAAGITRRRDISRA